MTVWLKDVACNSWTKNRQTVFPVCRALLLLFTRWKVGKERLEENTSEQSKLKIAVEYDYKHINTHSKFLLTRDISYTVMRSFTSVQADIQVWNGKPLGNIYIITQNQQKPSPQTQAWLY